MKKKPIADIPEFVSQTVTDEAVRLAERTWGKGKQRRWYLSDLREEHVTSVVASALANHYDYVIVEFPFRYLDDIPKESSIWAR